VLAAAVLGPGIIAALTLLALPSRLGEFFDDDRLVGTVGYSNGEAAFLLVPFWVALYVAGSRHVSPGLRAAVLAGAVLSLNLAVLTQSRGAMVALAVSLPVFFLLSGQRLRGFFALLPAAIALFVSFPSLNRVYLTLSDRGDVMKALEDALPLVWLGAVGAALYGLCWALVDARWRPGKRLTRSLGTIVLVACLVIFTIGANVLVERAGEPIGEVQRTWEAFKTNDTAGQDQSRYLSASGTGRFTLWQVAWKDFAASPVFGVGAQNWEATYYELREQPGEFARQPHSLPLEVLSERGLVGGILLLGFVGICVVPNLWQRYTKFQSEGKAQAGALFAAMAYWFVHSSVEWFWQLPAVTMPAILFLALLVAPWETSTEQRPLRWSLRVGGAGLAVLTLLIIVPLFVADRGLERSFATEDPELALASVERAQRYNPLDSRLALREAEVAKLSGDWDRAEEAYKQAIQLTPDHYAPYAVLAASYQVRGRTEEALRYYRKAISLNPLDYQLKQTRKRLQDADLGGDVPER
jgi:O-antigen ligase